MKLTYTVVGRNMFLSLCIVNIMPVFMNMFIALPGTLVPVVLSPDKAQLSESPSALSLKKPGVSVLSPHSEVSRRLVRPTVIP